MAVTVVLYRKSGGKIITQPNCHKCRGKVVQKPQKTNRGKPQEDGKEIHPHGHDPEKTD